MSNLSLAVILSILAGGSFANGDYGFAIAHLLLSGLNVLVYLIDRNEKTKQAFIELEKIFFEQYGKDEKNDK